MPARPPLPPSRSSIAATARDDGDRPRSSRRGWRRIGAGVLGTATAGVLAAALVAPAGQQAEPAPSTEALAPASSTPNPVTPGSFTGYGFDQCLAPTQHTMDRWLAHSPFLAVGIYISGDSRACRSQPNLTPQWVRTQLAKGWRLLPITLGPQASCQPRFPRYRDDRTIDPTPGANGRYQRARTMGVESARSTVVDAQALGLTPGSTLWYDMEGYDSRNTHCRESALAFMSAWNAELARLGYVPGVYSSAGSGIKDLDDARVNRPGQFTLPQQIWIARWDGKPDTSTSYIREDGWRPGGRMKQYLGDHVERWGGVSINIDSNWLDLGVTTVPAARHCDGTVVSFPSYPTLRPAQGGTASPPRHVRALQCLLKERGLYTGPIHGRYGRAVVRAVQARQAQAGMPQSDQWRARDWVALHAVGPRPVLKRGSAGPEVRRVQRALNASGTGPSVRASGVFDAATDTAVRRYQGAVGVPLSGVVNHPTWVALRKGRR